MIDNLNKYISLSDEFSNKAGWLMQVYEQQIRICEQISRSKMDDDQKKLILSCIETQKTAADLCEFTIGFLREVMKDAQVIEGAKTRNIIDDQSELLKYFLDDTTRKDKEAITK